MDSNADERLKKLVKDSGKTLTEIAVNSGVPYQILWRWSRGQTSTFDVNLAEKLCIYLTGKSFTIEA